MIRELGDAFLDKVEEYIGFIILVLAVVLLAGFAWLGWAMFEDANSPVLMLQKNEWVCTDSYQTQTTIFIEAGDVDVPQTIYTTVCVEYRRHQ